MKALVFALLLCLCVPAWSMTASPMGQTLEPTTTTGSLRIRNDGKGEKRYQVLVDVVSVDANGQKVYTPAEDFTFYPSSVITLAPGKVQTLRWKRGPTEGREVLYQVELREQSLDTADAVRNSQGMMITIRPRMLLPWAFVPKGAQPVMKVHREPGYLVFVNAGSATASLQKISYAGKPLPGPQLVLPGERLRLPVKSSGSSVSFVQKGVAQTLAVE